MRSKNTRTASIDSCMSAHPLNHSAFAVNSPSNSCEVVVSDLMFSSTNWELGIHQQ
jgi:hypothetical protein